MQKKKKKIVWHWLDSSSNVEMSSDFTPMLNELITGGGPRCSEPDGRWSVMESYVIFLYSILNLIIFLPDSRVRNVPY